MAAPPGRSGVSYSPGAGEGGDRSTDDRALHDARPWPTYEHVPAEQAEMEILLQGLPPTAANSLFGPLKHMPEGIKASAWQKCLSAVGKFDQNLCQAYREQIDTLLVFAGLFSAVVTAFAVESYQWLLDDPQDTSVELLRDIVVLLSRDSNATTPLVPKTVPRLSDTAVTRINVFWFSSLSLSLSAALVGILCKQWLREYERDVGQSPEQALAVRHVRSQGLEYWKVGTIVNAVPIVLQVALALFLVGIVDLLWRLHVAVAACVTVVSGITLVLYLSTTFFPSIQYAYICLRCCGSPTLTRTDYPSLKAFTEPKCAFKSAQAWIVLRLFQSVIEHLLEAYADCFTFHNPPERHALVVQPADSWVTFDVHWVKRLEHLSMGARPAFKSLGWIASHLSDIDSSSWIWHCVWSRWLKNRDSLDALVDAAVDIEAVGPSYADLAVLDWDNSPAAISQALIFQCSLHPELPVNTAVELLLRVAPVIGVHSRWTRDALHGVLHVYRGLSIFLDDDLALGLYDLAEHVTRAIIRGTDGPNSASQYNGAISFHNILILIYRGSPLHTRLLPAMCGLTLQWLRSRPPEPVALVARIVMEDIIVHLAPVRFNRARLRSYPGIVLQARLASAVADLWPGFSPSVWYPYQQFRPFILEELSAISSEWLADAARMRSGDVTRSPPAEEPSGLPLASASNSHVIVQTAEPPVDQAGHADTTPPSTNPPGGENQSPPLSHPDPVCDQDSPAIPIDANLNPGVVSSESCIPGQT